MKTANEGERKKMLSCREDLLDSCECGDDDDDETETRRKEEKYCDPSSLPLKIDVLKKKRLKNG